MTKELRYPVFEVKDPKNLNDEVALLTEWTPLLKKPRNYKTHSLKEPKNGKVILTPAILPKVYLMLGLLLPGLFLISFAKAQNKITPGTIIGQLLSGLAVHFNVLFFNIILLVFATALLRLLILSIRYSQHVFDLNKGYYFAKNLRRILFSSHTAYGVELSKIHSLQLIKGVNDDKQRTYELNLVFEDGRRKNLASHSDSSDLLIDSKDLAFYTKIPLWNAIDL